MRRDYLGRATLAASAMFLPGIGSVVILLIMATAYSDDVQAAIGLGGSTAAIVTVVASGFVVTTIRARTAGRSLEGELTGAVGTAMLLLLASIAIALLSPVLSRSDAGGFFAVYWIATIPATVLTPIGFVFNGAFQALRRDGTNLITAVTGTLVKAAVAAVVVLLGVSPLAAVAAVGATTSVASILGALVRGSQLARADMISWPMFAAATREALAHPVVVVRSLGERAAASVDGLVFLVTFTAAILVATAHSPADGAVVALSVAVMRSVIVPLKQFGVVGARFVIAERRGSGRDRADAMRLSTVQVNCFVLLAAIAVALTVTRLALPVFDQLGWLVVAMMAGQLLIEPWAGVLYSYRKIALSTAAGLPALGIAYGAVAGPGLTLLAVTRSGSAEAIWAVLLATRVVFAVLLAWTPRISMPAGSDWRRGVIRRRRDAT
ncbi:hypothetical protein O1W71_05230 [Microbacterium sp. H37-C3]|uniref:hypothetical protein n=1 Tax=Microbacterium sp. H37-C3 TaxID=3004354 RepID=UPI0022AE77E3|nr:hypothetical protein [Microbacterium sp. H37-C3]MCZ4067066.1 hypothetical protein [Microbacterium sp. H37-C3]